MSRAYGWDDDRVTIVDTEADELRAMAKTLLDGGTLRGLVADLEARKVLTVSGKPWQPLTIKRALTRPRMIGKKESSGGLVDGGMQPILDTATYEQLVELLHDPSRSRYTPSRSNDYLLGGGIVRCGVCGRPLHHATLSARPSVYSCAVRSGGCGRVSIQAAEIEGDITERVLARMADAGFRRDLADAINAEQSTSDAERELAEIDRRFEVLGEDYADGVIERATMHAGTERIRARREALRLQIRRTEVVADFPVPEVEQVVAWWEDASNDRRRDVVSVLVDHVTVRQSKNRRADPDRIHCEWKQI